MRGGLLGKLNEKGERKIREKERKDKGKEIKKERRGGGYSRGVRGEKETSEERERNQEREKGKFKWVWFRHGFRGS